MKDDRLTTDDDLILPLLLTLECDFLDLCPKLDLPVTLDVAKKLCKSTLRELADREMSDAVGAEIC